MLLNVFVANLLANFESSDDYIYSLEELKDLECCKGPCGNPRSGTVRCSVYHCVISIVRVFFEVVAYLRAVS
jgi:hypothetical protein